MTATHRLRVTLAIGLTGLSLAGMSGIGAAATPKHASHHKASHKTASTAPGSLLGSINVDATSSSVRMPFYSHQGEDVESEIPYATTMLATGGVGQSLSSVMWPGETGANGGNVLALLNINGVPTSVEQDLNDPEKAEAQTGVGDATVSKSSPGVDMTATAKPTYLSASAGSSASALPTVGKDFGSTNATTTIDVTGPKTVVSTATSTVHDVTIANVLKIGAVTSIAKATSTGKAATGSAQTTVSNASVAGIAVTIDGSGVHVTRQQSTGKKSVLPLPKLPSLTNVVDTALKKADLSVSLTNATKKIKKAHAVLNTGALVLSLNNSGYTGGDNDTGNVIILGGATLDADTSPGFATPSVPTAPASSVGAGTTTPSNPGTPGTPGTPGSPGTSTGQSPEVAGSPSSPASTVLAAASYRLFDGLKVWWVVLAGLMSGLIAFGLKRLPDRIFTAAGPACRLEE